MTSNVASDAGIEIDRIQDAIALFVCCLVWIFVMHPRQPGHCPQHACPHGYQYSPLTTHQPSTHSVSYAIYFSYHMRQHEFPFFEKYSYMNGIGFSYLEGRLRMSDIHTVRPLTVVGGVRSVP